jgi:hypothetical protein
MPPKVDTQLIKERDQARLVDRPQLDTRTPGRAVFAKAVTSEHIEARGTGVDAGTGDVKFYLTKTGVKAGAYNNFVVDEFGRILNATYVAPVAGPTTGAINDQFEDAQDANFWISGNARVDGSITTGNIVAVTIEATGIITAQSMTLVSPLPISSGGTGATMSPPHYVFAGPAIGTGDGTLSLRVLVLEDLPIIPFDYLQNTPDTLAGYGINNAYTKTESDNRYLQSVSIATASALGVVKVGPRLSIDASGILQADEQPGTYELPAATNNVLGGVKISGGLDVAVDGSLTNPLVRTVTQVAHGFGISMPVHMNNDGTFIQASASSLTTLCTHYVVSTIDADHFVVAKSGTFLMPGAPTGLIYLSNVAGSWTTSEPTADVRQVIGQADGQRIYLDIQTHVVVFVEPTTPFPTDLIVGLANA